MIKGLENQDNIKPKELCSRDLDKTAENGSNNSIVWGDVNALFYK